MGQQCGCLQVKSKRLAASNTSIKPKLECSTPLKPSLSTKDSKFLENTSKKKILDVTKENVDSILPNNSIAMSIYEVHNNEVNPKNNEENDYEMRLKRVFNLETVSLEKKAKNLYARDFDFQQELNKPKISVLEIYKKDHKGTWTEDRSLKDLCKNEDEISKGFCYWKYNKKDSFGRKDRDIVEELAP